MEENNNEIQTPRTINPLIALVVVLVLIAAGVGFLLIKGGGVKTNALDETPTPAIQSNSGVDSSSVEDSTGAEKVFEIKAGSFNFTPNEIRVKKGDKVKIVLSAQDSMHNFSLDEFSVKTPITRSGEKNEVVFTADKTGTFEFYCAIANHRKMGQVGKLIVEE